MSLSVLEAIELHLEFDHPRAQRNSFGDGFLYASNPIYQWVRDIYLEMGYEFTGKDFCDAETFPLLSLRSYLRSKKVYVADNAGPVQRLSKTLPKKFPFQSLAGFSVRKNFLLHEACHCIAYEFLEFGPKREPEKKPVSEDWIFETLVSEAFALAVETLAESFAQGEAHLALYFYNSHRHLAPGANKNLSDLIVFSGLSKALEHLVWSYLAHAFLTPDANPQFFAKLLESLGYPRTTAASERKSLHSASRCTQFMGSFYYQTSKAYFSAMGTNSPLLQLVNFESLKTFAERKNLKRKIQTLCRIVTDQESRNLRKSFLSKVQPPKSHLCGL